MKVKKQYLFLNKLAKGNGVVLWGSTALDNQPVNELLQSFHVSKNIYNRSISGLTLAEAESCLEQCVYELAPSKLIINLGEEDVKNSDNVAQMIEQYRWLLYKIHVTLPAFLGAVKLSLYDSDMGYSGIATRAVFDLMMQ